MRYNEKGSSHRKKGNLRIQLVCLDEGRNVEACRIQRRPPVAFLGSEGEGVREVWEPGHRFPCDLRERERRASEREKLRKRNMNAMQTGNWKVNMKWDNGEQKSLHIKRKFKICPLGRSVNIVEIQKLCRGKNPKTLYHCIVGVRLGIVVRG